MSGNRNTRIEILAAIAASTLQSKVVNWANLHHLSMKLDQTGLSNMCIGPIK